MVSKIVNIQEFNAVGLTYFGDNQNGEIPKLWDVFNRKYENIKHKSKSLLCYGICDDEPDSEGKYLVYTYNGTIKDLGKFYCNIFSTWLPSSGYEIDYRPQLELYDERFMKNGEFDIYIPIK